MSNPPQSDGTPAESGPLPGGPLAGRFEVRVTADSHFAWLRTRLSVERTLMSWVPYGSLADWVRLRDRAVL
jgi:hypothetical protein